MKKSTKNKGQSKPNISTCLRCNKNKIDEENAPFCRICWCLIESDLVLVSPINVLTVMKTEMTYKEIMAQVKMKKYCDVSGAFATSLRKLIRMRLVRLADKNTPTYAVTDMGKIVLAKINQ